MSAIVKGSEVRQPEGARCKRCHKIVREDGHDGWCSSDCREAESQEVSQGKLRELVLERDNGVCSLCNLDTLALRTELDGLLARAKLHPEDRAHARQLSARLHQLAKLGFDRQAVESGRALWECDHVTARVLGGASTPQQCRTLCLQCHRQVTGELASSRADSRRPLRDRRTPRGRRR